MTAEQEVLLLTTARILQKMLRGNIGTLADLDALDAAMRLVQEKHIDAAAG